LNTETGSRFALLRQLLASDPGNRALVVDAAEAALDERRPADAAALLEAAPAPFAPHESNLLGIAALQLGRHEQASAIFESLMASGNADDIVRANLAWARAMSGDKDGALALIDDALSEGRPEAAMLKVQLLHERGEFDEAAAHARGYVDRHPHHRGLLAAVSVLALDVEDAELALRTASAAGDHPDALATLGTLALRDDRATEALVLYDRALEGNHGVPRAWVGRGLARLLAGETEAAPADLDRGAELFGDHLGSWIAAGWAHFVNRDFAAARARFDKALALDPTFAESHSSLAVLDLLDGRTEEAERRCKTALGLDRECYSAALARSLLAAGRGDKEEARRVFEAAINTPVDREGRTIAQAMARIGI
jgi:tetratricopeptide (TPR) repeat protein